MWKISQLDHPDKGEIIPILKHTIKTYAEVKLQFHAFTSAPERYN
jgi:hypothetical protein